MNTSQAKHQKSKRRIKAHEVYSNVFCCLGFGLGAGLAPKAPGTFGTLVALPLYWWLSDVSLLHYGLITLALFGIGIPICEQTQKKLNIGDHSGIVWDEIVGFLITMFGFPISWKLTLLGFALFRLFDALKPWPISVLDRRVHGGLGIMFDDALAGLLAWVCLYMIQTQFVL